MAKIDGHGSVQEMSGRTYDWLNLALAAIGDPALSLDKGLRMAIERAIESNTMVYDHAVREGL